MQGPFEQPSKAKACSKRGSLEPYQQSLRSTSVRCRWIGNLDDSAADTVRISVLMRMLRFMGRFRSILMLQEMWDLFCTHPPSSVSKILILVTKKMLAVHLGQAQAFRMLYLVRPEPRIEPDRRLASKLAIRRKREEIGRSRIASSTFEPWSWARALASVTWLFAESQLTQLCPKE